MLLRSMRGLVPSSGFLGHVWVCTECRGMGRGRWLVIKYDKNFLFGVPTTTTAANHSCMDIAQNLINAYKTLGRRMHETLHIQHGDVTCLRAQIDEVKAFAADAGRVCLAFFRDITCKLKLIARLVTYWPRKTSLHCMTLYRRCCTP